MPDPQTTIKHLRNVLDLSAREFGEACGLQGGHMARTVYRWEAGDQEPNGASQMLIEQLKAKVECARKRQRV